MRRLVVLLSVAAFLVTPCPSEAQVNNIVADEVAEPRIEHGPNGPEPLPPPGPGQIRLEGNVIPGGAMNVPAPKDGWLHIGFTGMFCPYAGGKYLTFTREGVRIYLSIDEGPRQLAGVKVTGSADVAAVAEALKEESPLRLVLWCTCCVPAEFGKLKELEKIAYLRPVFRRHSSVVMAEFNDLRGLSCLTSLTSLSIRGTAQLIDLRPLAKLTKLTSLSLRGCERLTGLSPLAKLGRLESLNLSLFNRMCAPQSFTDISPLSGLTSLKSLDLSYHPDLADVTPLAALSELRSLSLAGCSRVTDLWPLENLVQLRNLNLNDSRNFSDLRPLSKLTNLETLSLVGCDSVHDLNPLRPVAAKGHVRWQFGLSVDGRLVGQAKELETVVEVPSR